MMAYKFPLHCFEMKTEQNLESNPFVKKNKMNDYIMGNLDFSLSSFEWFAFLLSKPSFYFSVCLHFYQKARSVGTN